MKILSRVQHRYKELVTVLATIFLFAAATYLSQTYAEQLRTSLGSYGAFGGVTYVVATTLAVVVAPVSTFPLLPVAATLWGSFWAAILSVLGWWLGAMIAFWLARQFGQPLIRKIVNFHKIERLSRAIPQQNLFWTVVFLRMAIPVDVLSYALGLFTMISAGTFALATLVGIAPFAFLFAYAVTMPFWFQAAVVVFALTFASFGVVQARRRLKE
jgi:uncharacterized membrane protein YdjX (TVP38/TMEM64 family)